jgi:hypothetical protein
LDIELHGVRAYAAARGHHDIDVDIARVYHKRHHTGYRRHHNATIKDPCTRIRIKQLDSEGYPWAIVRGDGQVEVLFDKDIVAIYISSSHEIPFHDDTITLKSWVQELGGGRCVIGFLLLKQGTAATRAVSIVAVIVMVVSIAPAQDSCE